MLHVLFVAAGGVQGPFPLLVTELLQGARHVGILEARAEELGVALFGADGFVEGLVERF